MIINDEWEIESDELNIVLMHKRSKTHYRSKANAPITYDSFYYGTISGALIALLDKEVKATELKDLQAINGRITKIEQDIRMAIGNIKRVPVVS